MKKFTRVMAGLVCGAIVASTASVSAFAGELRGLQVADMQNGKIEILTKETNFTAEAEKTVMVQVTPNEGYAVAPQFNQNQNVMVSFTTGTYADKTIKCIDSAKGIYTFEMPWSDPAHPIILIADFVPAK